MRRASSRGRSVCTVLALVLGATAADAAPTATPTALDRANRAFDAEQWEPAAIALEEVTRTGEPWEREIADWELAIALFRLHLPVAAFARFSAIADHPNHARFHETLRWMVALSLALPEPADVAERIGKWDRSELDRVTATDRATYANLRFATARDDYVAGRYERALTALADVTADSPTWTKAQLFCAAANVQLRRSAPALACLHAAEGTNDPVLRDVTKLALARTLYSDSFRLGEGNAPTIDRAQLDAAIAAWSSVDRTSPLWLDALAEQAWAYFMERDDARALGNLHTLDAPFFADAYFPDAWLLRALVEATNCQWESATTTALAFQRRHLPIEAELAHEIARLEGPEGERLALAFVEDANAGRAALPAVRRLARDRPLAREAEWLHFIDAERARVDAAPALRAGPLHAVVADALDLARALASAELGRHVRRALRDEHTTLERDLRESAALLIALPSLMAGGRAPPGAGSAAPRAIVVDPEHVKWPFDGEFWRDELGFYRVAVEPRCAR